MNSIKFCADINKAGLPFATVTEGTFKGLCFLLDSAFKGDLKY